MNYTKQSKVKLHDGKIGIIDRVFYEMIDGKETNNVYCYEMTIDDKSGYVVYPDEIE